jgi:hypothetical protein
MRRFTLFAGAMLALLPVAAQAGPTYDAYQSFDGNQLTNGFLYGTRAGGGMVFNSGSGCFYAGTTCLKLSGSDFPAVFKNSGAAIIAGTVTIPGASLVLQPGVNASAQVRFYSSSAQTLYYSADFTRLDSRGGFAAVTAFTTTTVDPFLLLSASQPTLHYEGYVTLGAGDYIGFDIDPANDGPATDAIGFRFTLGDAPSVPEPASWAMMIAGFGIAGAAMRRRATPLLNAG